MRKQKVLAEESNIGRYVSIKGFSTYQINNPGLTMQDIFTTMPKLFQIIGIDKSGEYIVRLIDTLNIEFAVEPDTVIF